MKFRSGAWLPILLLAAAWSCHSAAFGAASPVEDRGWVPIEPSAIANSADEAPKFGSRIKLRSSRFQTTQKAAKSNFRTTSTTTTTTTTTTPEPTTTRTTTHVPTTKQSVKITKSATKSKQQQRPPRQQPLLIYSTSTTTPVPDDEETKSLSQQVKDGKYGLIQNELFSAQPSRPGIISYSENYEIPKDNSENLGGLKPDEIWLSEGHVLVLSGSLKDDDGEWEPIDDYQAPPRQVKLPPNPSVPPPFPVQLHDGGPTGFVTSRNGSNPALQPFRPPGNLGPGNGLYPPSGPFPPQHHPFLPPPPPLDPNKPLDEDDPSIYYPPPYDFSFHGDNSTELPPGPLVPGIILPPPPDFFAPQNRTKPKLVVPGQTDPFDLGFIPPDHRPYRPVPRPTFAPSPPPPTYAPAPPPTYAPVPRPVQSPVVRPRPVTTTPVTTTTTTTTTTTPQTFVDNEIVVPEYPRNEPNVVLHHHGSPIYYIPDPFYIRNITYVSPPEQVFVYEVPLSAPRRKQPKQKTVVSSTPAPTALYYTLPPDSGVQISVYTAAPPVEDRKPKYYPTNHSPNVVSQEFFTSTQKPPKYVTTTAKPSYRTQKPHAIVQEYYTTQKPVSSTNQHAFVQTTTASSVYAPETTPRPTLSPIFLQDSFQPSYDFPYQYSTTPAPPSQYYNANRGRYYSGVQNDVYAARRPYDGFVPSGPAYSNINVPRQQQIDLLNLLKNNPNAYYLPRRPVSPTAVPPSAYNPLIYQQQQHPVQSNYYANRQPYLQHGHSVQTTANPIFNGLYTQEDAKYMDDFTKGLFNEFGQKVATTPLPPQSPTQVPLHDDIRVNYRQPLPAINPDSEFINVRDPAYVSYQLPGQGRRGPSHYYYISPRSPRGTTGEETPKSGGQPEKVSSSRRNPARKQ